MRLSEAWRIERKWPSGVVRDSIDEDAELEKRIVVPDSDVPAQAATKRRYRLGIEVMKMRVPVVHGVRHHVGAHADRRGSVNGRQHVSNKSFIVRDNVIEDSGDSDVIERSVRIGLFERVAQFELPARMPLTRNLENVRRDVAARVANVRSARFVKLEEISKTAADVQERLS